MSVSPAPGVVTSACGSDTAPEPRGADWATALGPWFRAGVESVAFDLERSAGTAQLVAHFLEESFEGCVLGRY